MPLWGHRCRGDGRTLRCWKTVKISTHGFLYTVAGKQKNNTSPRTATACDNLYKVAQAKNPMLIGSAMLDLLLRLSDLQDEIYPPKTQPKTK